MTPNETSLLQEVAMLAGSLDREGAEWHIVRQLQEAVGRLALASTMHLPPVNLAEVDSLIELDDVLPGTCSIYRMRDGRYVNRWSYSEFPDRYARTELHIFALEHLPQRVAA